MVDKFLDYCYYYLVEIVIKFKIFILNLIMIHVVSFYRYNKFLLCYSKFKEDF